MKLITLTQLQAANACSGQVELFKKHFPTGEVEVTQKLCKKVAQVFDFGWAAHNLLTPTALTQYDEAIDHGQKHAHEEVSAPAFKQYEEAIATATARKQYEDDIAPAMKQYNEATAVAFAKAYNSYWLFIKTSHSPSHEVNYSYTTPSR